MIGPFKLDALSRFFDQILEDPSSASDAQISFTMQTDSEAEVEPLTPEEEEITRKQEAQRLALLHGGFSDMIDFEEALKNGGSNFHGHGGGFGEL